MPSRPRRRPMKSASRSPASRRQHRSSLAQSRRSAARSKGCRHSSTIAAAVEEQGAATQEISRNVQQAARTPSRCPPYRRRPARRRRDGSASSQVLSAAQMLSGDSNRLKTEVGKFLQRSGRPSIAVDTRRSGTKIARPGAYCRPVSPLVRFLARSISVTAIRISARVFRSGASSIACFSAGP